MPIFEAAEYNGQVRQCAPKIKMMGGALSSEKCSDPLSGRATNCTSHVEGDHSELNPAQQMTGCLPAWENSGVEDAVLAKPGGTFSDRSIARN